MSDPSSTSVESNSAKSAEVISMTAAVEARQLITAIAGPSTIGGGVKEALTRVARKTGLGHRRVRGIWNGEARAIRAEELDALRRAAKPKAETNALQDFASRLAAVEARLTSIDPEFHSGQIAELRDLHDRIGRLVSRG